MPLSPGLPARPRRWAAGLALLLVAGAAPLTTAPASSAAVAPRADYQLQRTLVSSVGPANALTSVGTTGFATTTVDGTAGRTVLRYPKGSGLARSSALTSLSATAYTVALLYRPLETSGAYHRILDLNGGAGDVGLYERAGTLVAYPQAASASAVLSATTFNQVVLTRTAGKVVTAYVNGRKVLSFTDSGNAWLATASVRFGKDNTSAGATGEETGGDLARIRLWDTALSATDVTSLDRLPDGTSDLAVTYVDAPDPVLRGSLLAYTATVTSGGPSAARAATVALTVPPGTTVTGSSPSRGTCAAPASGRVVCALGDLAVGEKAQVLLVLRAPTTAGSTSSTATVSTSGTDGTARNDTAVQGTTVR